MISSGEEKAWEILKGLHPADVCKNASVFYDEKSDHYVLKSFCSDFQINVQEKIIKSPDHSGEVILNRYGYFFVHSCLWYLIHSKDIPFTGRLSSPASLRGGDIFFRGSHVLPLDRLAKAYGTDKQSFIEKGKELCADSLTYGDASIQLFPLPRVPVNLVLWTGDEEFPSRAEMLLDSSCEIQLPLDIIWSIAMLSVLVMI